MDTDQLDRLVLAYFLAGPAKDINIAGRFYPYSELVLILEDKFAIATRKFGMKVKGRAKPVATGFVDAMIAKGAWSTKQNDFGGTMHQFQLDTYRATLKDMQADEPLVAEGEGQGAEFWADKFSALTAA